jgi:hypothetical protein
MTAFKTSFQTRPIARMASHDLPVGLVECPVPSEAAVCDSLHERLELVVNRLPVFLVLALRRRVSKCKKSLFGFAQTFEIMLETGAAQVAVWSDRTCGFE